MKVKIYDNGLLANRDLDKICKAFKNDALVIYPTDSLYAMGVALSSKKGVEKIIQKKGKSKYRMSMLFSDIAMLSSYLRIDDELFKVIRKNSDKPVTYILNSEDTQVKSRELKDRKEFGVRIPQNPVIKQIIEALEEPILSTSLWFEGGEDESEVIRSAEVIYETHSSEIDLLIDYGVFEESKPSAVVAYQNGEFEIIREGEFNIEGI